MGAHDQAAYLRSAAALARFDFRAEAHYYPIGYAVLAAPFYPLLQGHAFFVPNVLCYLGSVYLLYRIFRFLLKPVEAFVLAVVLLGAFPLQLRSLLVPWTSIPTQVLMYWAVFRVGLGRDIVRDLRTAGVLCGLILFFRPANVAVCLVVVLVRVIVERQNEAIRPAVKQFAATAAATGLVWVVAQYALYGQLLSSYQATAMTVGFTMRRWLEKVFFVFVNSEIVFPPADSLLKSFPHLIVSGPGLVYLVGRVPRVGWPIVGATVVGFGEYLLFNDFWPHGIYRFGLFHYIAWVMPVGGLLAYLSFRLALRSLGGKVWLGALLGPAVVYALVRLEGVSVPVEITGDGGRIEMRGDLGAVDVAYLEDWNDGFRFSAGGLPLQRFRDYLVFDTGSAFVVLFLRRFDAKILVVEGSTYRGDPQLIRAKGLRWRLGWGLRERVVTGPASRGDFDGDGRRDLLWHREASGEVTVHFYRGGALKGWRWLRGAGAAVWELVGAADFDRNGTPDLVWEDQGNGRVVVHFYTGTAFGGWDWLVRSGTPRMRVAAVADWDGDGQPDLIREDVNTGRVEIEYRGGRRGVEGVRSATVRTGGIAGWRLAGVADFDANGTCDLVWESELTRQVTVHYYSGTEMTGWRWLNISGMRGWRLVGVGDFNGDAHPDVIWRNETTDELAIHYYGGSNGDRLEAWLRLQTGSIRGWRPVVPF